RTGHALGALGVRPGDRVVLLCHDAPEFLGGLWGAIKLGAVPVPVNTFLKPEEWLYCLDDSAAPAALVSAALLPSAPPALEGARHLRHVLVAGGSPPETATAPGPRVEYHSYEGALAGARGVLEPAPTTHEDPAFWLYSSGSTGAPKAAVHRQRDMVV